MSRGSWSKRTFVFIFQALTSAQQQRILLPDTLRLSNSDVENQHKFSSQTTNMQPDPVNCNR